METFRRSLVDSLKGLHRFWVPMAVFSVVTPLLSLAFPLVEKYVVDDVILARNLDGLPTALGVFIGLWLSIMLIQTAGGLFRAYLGEQLTMRWRQRLMEQSERLSLPFSSRQHSGRTMALFMSDVPIVAGMHSQVVFSAVSVGIVIVISTVLMFALSWQLALIVAILPPLVSGLALIITRPLRPATRRAQEKTAELTERVQENLAGVREVIAFGQERNQGIRFSSTLTELLKLRMRVAWMDTAFQTGQSFFSLSVSLVILGFGGYLVINDQATIGTLFAIRTLFSSMFQALGSGFNLITGVQKSVAAGDRIYEFLDREPEVRDNPAGLRADAVAGIIAFDGVSFGYDPEARILHDVSFSVHHGELIALVGPSGAGKSTLAGLIPRFYDPQEGCVTLDGRDLRDYSLSSLRDQVGIVFQDTFLFATSIRDNIAFGRDGAAEEEIISAAYAAHAWEFIERMPNGLDTMVGERGVQLSEGQKQRIAIARALLRDPKILILDEPTSALDARSEHLLQAAFDNLMTGRTTFVIAHRLATIQKADRILVIDDGRLVEQGTHIELLQRHGLYRELYELQFGTATDPFEQKAITAPLAPAD